MEATEKVVGKLEGEIIGIRQELATLNKILLGNGQAGLQERTVRIEENIEQVSEQQKINSKSIEQVSKAIGELRILLELHLKDDKVHTFKGIFLKKEIIGYFILFIIGITSLLPRDVNLWELIKNLLF